MERRGKLAALRRRLKEVERSGLPGWERQATLLRAQIADAEDEEDGVWSDEEYIVRTNLQGVRRDWSQR